MPSRLESLETSFNRRLTNEGNNSPKVIQVIVVPRIKLMIIPVTLLQVVPAAWFDIAHLAVVILCRGPRTLLINLISKARITATATWVLSAGIGCLFVLGLAMLVLAVLAVLAMLAMLAMLAVLAVLAMLAVLAVLAMLAMLAVLALFVLAMLVLVLFLSALFRPRRAVGEP